MTSRSDLSDLQNNLDRVLDETQNNPLAVWNAVFPDGSLSEDSVLVGAIVFVNQGGEPDGTGFLLESLDGERLVTCTNATRRTFALHD